MKYWLLTLKKNVSNPLDVHAEDYVNIVEWMNRNYTKFVITDNAFETDSHGVLHFHCIVATNYIRWQKLTDYLKGSLMHVNNVQLNSIEDLKRARQYLMKQKLNPYECEQKQTISTIQAEDYPFDIQII